MHDLGSAPFILDLLPHDHRFLDVVMALLGGPLRSITQTRGVYAIFPIRTSSDPSGASSLNSVSLAPHIDGMCHQLNSCATLTMLPRSGGSTVYPRSRELIFHAHESGSNYSPTDFFRQQLQKVLATILPYEVVARPALLAGSSITSNSTPGCHILLNAAA